MKKLIISSISSILLLSGCSSLSEDTLANNEGMVCEKKAATGSNIKKRTCMSKKLSEEIRRKNQDSMREINKRGNIYQGKN